MNHSITSWRRSLSFVAAATGSLVVVADWLFYQRPLGCSAGIFAAMVLLTLALRGPEVFATWAGRIFAAALLGLVFAMVEEPGQLNIAMTLLGLGFLAMTERGGWAGGVNVWLGRWGRFLLDVAFRCLIDNRLVARWFNRRPEARPRVLRFIFGWTIPLILGAVFITLFWLANPVISQWIDAAYNWLVRLIENFPDIFSIPRTILWVAVGIWAWALLRTRGRRRREGKMAVARPPPLPGDPWEARVRRLVLRSLILFNLIFLVQTALDIRYLGGGAKLPAGVTYKEYARQGAYPLLAAAILAAVFVLVTFRNKSTTQRDPWARRLVYAWLGQNILLTISAIVRLAMYVNAFSLTRLRVAAAIWMALVAMGLAWIIWRIVAGRDNAWLLKRNLVTASLVLYACCFVNFDRFIADYDVNHCVETGTSATWWLQVEYLVELGPDALPALVRVRDKIPDGPRHDVVVNGIRQLNGELTTDLADWRGWTWRRARLMASLPSGLPIGIERDTRLVDTPRVGRWTLPLASQGGYDETQESHLKN